jgi:aminoglycoside 3-N-acetyltransferase I
MEMPDTAIITYRKLESKDLHSLIELIKMYEEVFEMDSLQMPSAEYLQQLLDKESIIFFVALSDNVVLGGLSGHILPSVYIASSEVYIFDFGVRTQDQRKGIGKQLIQSLKDYCSKLRYKEIFVQADVEDEHAMNFYYATGGQAKSAWHYSYALD